jgi:hypothetical protein
MLAINDRKLAALYRRDYDGSELRPIEVLGDLIDVGCAPPTDFALVRDIDDKLSRLYPFQEWCGSWREFGYRRIEPLRAEGYKHCMLHFPMQQTCTPGIWARRPIDSQAGYRT